MRKLLLLVALVSCGAIPFHGAPAPGTECLNDPRRALLPECISADEVAYCENGKWVSYTCPSDCRNAQTVRCDWSLAEVGAECPAYEEGRRFCSAGSDTKFRRCVNGRIEAAECMTGACYGNCG